MDVQLMLREIVRVADAMIGESFFPDFVLTAGRVGEAAFDELNRTFERNIRRRRDQEMHVIGHENERVEKKSPLAPIVIESLQEQSRARFNHEHSSSLERRERHEISSGRRDGASGLHDLSG
jgi:hypothetical protein